MSYDKVYFVKIQYRSLTNPRVLKHQMPTEVFKDYRDAMKSLREEVESYREGMGYKVERDEFIEDLYCGYDNGVKMVELTIGGLIIR